VANAILIFISLYLPYQLLFKMHTSKDIILDIIHCSFKERMKNEKTAIYIQILNLLKNKIEEHNIPSESDLPSTRALAKSLGVSRSTVIKVYNLLCIEGYIKSKQGSGYVVNSVNLSTTNNQKINTLSDYPDISKRGKLFSENASLIHSTTQKDIAFRPGLPPLDVFPVNHWKRLYNSYWKQIKFSNLTFSDSSGIEYLKKNIAIYLNLVRGIKCDHEQIIIVSGSLQSLYLIANSILNPNDGVVMENPTFPNVQSIFRSLDAHISALPVDEEGMDIDQYTTADASYPKLIHVTPSNQYPTGKRMSLERKNKIVNWAQKHKSIIIENDYDHEISNWNDKKESIFSLDNNNRTVFLGTFNRLLHQSIRLGYMVVPYYLLDVIKALQMHSHRFVSPSNQIVMSQFIEKNYIYNHIKNVVNIASERKLVFEKYFTELMPKDFEIQKSDAQSLHILAKIPEEIKDKELTKALFKNHINVHHYSKCFINSSQNGLIFGYSSVKIPVMIKKLNKMQSVIQKIRTK